MTERSETKAKADESAAGCSHGCDNPGGNPGRSHDVLLRCPFCGSDVELQGVAYGESGRFDYSITCRGCNISVTEWLNRPDKLREVWNTRAKQSLPDSELVSRPSD